jgi:hypothetical protein
VGVDLGKQEGGFLLDALNGVGAGDPHAVHPPRVIRSVIARGTLISHLFCPSPAEPCRQRPIPVWQR